MACLSREPHSRTGYGSKNGQSEAHGAERRLAAQAALVELVEEQGLPPVCAALAVAEDAEVPLGRVLAQAVQVRAPQCLSHRSRTPLRPPDSDPEPVIALRSHPPSIIGRSSDKGTSHGTERGCWWIITAGPEVAQ